MVLQGRSQGVATSLILQGRSQGVATSLILLILVNQVWTIQCASVVRMHAHSLKQTPEQINAADDLRAEYLQRKAFAKIDRGGVATRGATDVYSGLSIGTPNYVTNVMVGTPQRNQTFMLDTGSDLSWMQCQPCRACYPQENPVFDPKTTASIKWIGCDNVAKCTNLLGPYKASCDGDMTPCSYSESYLDGSVTKGLFITELMRIEGHTAKPVPYSLGCGIYNKGAMSGYAGILALSRDMLSYPSQTNLSSFATCLPPPYSDESQGFIEWVPDPSTYSSSNFVCLKLMFPKYSGLYLVVLSSITVGSSSDDDSDASTASDNFSDAKPGALPNLMIFDTGALNSRLKETDYIPLRDAFKAATAKILTPAPSVMGYDLCFTYPSVSNALNKNLLPSVGLKFSGASTRYMLPPDSVLYRWTYSTSCLAFKITKGFAILGNNHQQGRRFHFDISKDVVCAQTIGSSCK